MAVQITVFIFIIICLLCLARGIYETYVLMISRVSMGTGNKKTRVFLFSDIHAGFLNIPSSDLVRAIESEKPDIILFAGDMVNSVTPEETRTAKSFLSDISLAAQKLDIPFYCVPGNHDTEGITEKVKQSGDYSHYEFIHNQSREFISGDKSRWKITGLADIRTGNPEYSSNNPPADLPEIILAHNPDTLLVLPLDNISSRSNVFFLSGHFHGGQIWMPFGLEYKILRKEKMAEMGFRRGYFSYRGIKGYITRGLGCVVFPLRFFSYPEAAVIDIFSDEKESIV